MNVKCGMKISVKCSVPGYLQRHLREANWFRHRSQDRIGTVVAVEAQLRWRVLVHPIRLGQGYLVANYRKTKVLRRDRDRG